MQNKITGDPAAGRRGGPCGHLLQLIVIRTILPLGKNSCTVVRNNTTLREEQREMPKKLGDETDTLGNIEEFLQQCLEGMEPDGRVKGPGRPRILPAMALWAGLLVCVLRGFGSQLALWRLISERGLWFFPRFEVTDQAVYKRLHSAGTEPLERLFEQISSVLAERFEGLVSDRLASFAEEVVCIDESTLEAISRTLPTLREIPEGDTRLLAGKLAGVFDLRRQQWRRVRFQPNPNQNEKVLARDLAAELPAGTLVVADLGYFGFAWFDWLTDRGCHWLSRLRAKTSYKVIHTFYQRGDVFDGIVWLGVHRADRTKHAVRLVTFRQGKTLRRYITNVREPHRFPIPSIAEVYARRWDIEMALALAKQHLKLRLLWSAKQVVIQQQIWATLIISQVLQSLRLEIAYKAGVDPFEVSIGLLVEYAPQYAYEGRDPVKVFVERGRELGFIRPSRRTRIQAPRIPVESILPAPPGLVLTRTPRYANRKCSRRTANTLKTN